MYIFYKQFIFSKANQHLIWVELVYTSQNYGRTKHHSHYQP